MTCCKLLKCAFQGYCKNMECPSTVFISADFWTTGLENHFCINYRKNLSETIIMEVKDCRTATNITILIDVPRSKLVQDIEWSIFEFLKNSLVASRTQNTICLPQTKILIVTNWTKEEGASANVSLDRIHLLDLQ